MKLNIENHQSNDHIKIEGVTSVIYEIYFRVISWASRIGYIAINIAITEDDIYVALYNVISPIDSAGLLCIEIT